MSFEEAQAYLDSLGVDAMMRRRPTRHRIEALCDALDHPERAVPAIHITGTNGKSSVARIAGALLGARGLSAGVFTSPHLVTVRERIALGGDPVDETVFGDVFDHVFPVMQLVERTLGEKLTYFELLTAMFYLWAAEAPVDANVVEVGLGGRWDATNVVDAPVAVVTAIELDHVAMLGNDKETIAREKAGIIKREAVVVTGERLPHVLEVILDEAAAAGARPVVLERDFAVVENKVALGGRYLSLRSGSTEFDGLFLPLHGSHQGVNAALAVEAVQQMFPAHALDRETVAEGLARVTAPGRIEVVPPRAEGAASIVLDVAHNPDGMSALVSALAETFAFDEVVFVVGVLADHDSRGILGEMARIPCSLVATRADSPRSLDPGELRVVAEELGLSCTVAPGVAEAIRGALDQVQGNGLVCVTGSHYLVGAARALLVPEPQSQEEE
jgi:dihydrofolate synthase/folylpolyglutamate synthase